MHTKLTLSQICKQYSTYLVCYDVFYWELLFLKHFWRSNLSNKSVLKAVESTLCSRRNKDCLFLQYSSDFCLLCVYLLKCLSKSEVLVNLFFIKKKLYELPAINLTPFFKKPRQFCLYIYIHIYIIIFYCIYLFFLFMILNFKMCLIYTINLIL